MKTALTTASALLIGVAMGALVVRTVEAQKRPPAYIVADNEVTDLDNYMKVVAPVAEKTTAEAGGRFLARGKPVSLSGDPPKGRLVIVQFENMDQLQKWWNNPEWQAAHKKGEQYAKFCDMAIEGRGPVSRSPPRPHAQRIASERPPLYPAMPMSDLYPNNP